MTRMVVTGAFPSSLGVKHRPRTYLLCPEVLSCTGTEKKITPCQKTIETLSTRTEDTRTAYRKFISWSGHAQNLKSCLLLDYTTFTAFELCRQRGSSFHSFRRFSSKKQRSIFGVFIVRFFWRNFKMNFPEAETALSCLSHNLPFKSKICKWPLGIKGLKSQIQFNYMYI